MGNVHRELAIYMSKRLWILSTEQDIHIANSRETVAINDSLTDL